MDRPQGLRRKPMSPPSQIARKHPLMEPPGTFRHPGAARPSKICHGREYYFLSGTARGIGEKENLTADRSFPEIVPSTERFLTFREPEYAVEG
jgi:hypothetical protein